MSGLLLLDGLALTFSLFNTLLLVWLGLTVLFNADRRAPGVLLAAGALLVGGSFFIGHTLVLNQGALGLLRGIALWWHLGWLAIIAAPLSFYLLMLWYSGYWEAPASRLRRRQRFWLAVVSLFTLALVLLLVFASPLPADEYGYEAPQRQSLVAPWLPVLLAYPPYLLLCVSLALATLLNPEPSGRVMGDLARRRARPWLVGASLVLLLVSLVVGGVFLWLTGTSAQPLSMPELLVTLAGSLAWIDLLLAALLALTILLIGQAVISYEIFTGATLPRRGFWRQWRNVVLLSAGMSLAGGFGLSADLPAIVSVLALILLAGFSYALFSWLSFGEREQSMRLLRPFTASPGLFESMLSPLPASGDALQVSFTALCQEVLGARRAALLPSGGLAALGLAPLRYPPGEPFALPPAARLAVKLSSAPANGMALEPGEAGGFIWAAALLSARGLSGLLLLGEKADGGIYSLEEIEVARLSAERLADLIGSAELARRLVALQRQRMAESGLLDQRARRVLHDEVLPSLHTALLQLSSASPLPASAALNSLAAAHRQISDLLRDLPRSAPPELTRTGLEGALRRLLEVEFKGQFDQVAWQVDAQAGERLASLPPLTAEVLYYAAREALRNAARYARDPAGARPLRLSVRLLWAAGLELQIEDNGGGLGAAVPDPAGSGQGLALHSTMLAVINGSLALESLPGEYTRVTLRLPEAALQLWQAG